MARLRPCKPLSILKVSLVLCLLFIVYVLIVRLETHSTQVSQLKNGLSAWIVDLYNDTNTKPQDINKNVDLVKHFSTQLAAKPTTTNQGLLVTVKTNKRIPNETCKRRIPQCIIIGAAKCGTKALVEFLSIHPKVAAKLVPEEVDFFNTYFQSGLAYYARQMPCSYSDQITIEKSPNYLTHYAVPRRVWEANKSMKLLLILRDPVIRTISDYTMALHESKERVPSFEEAIFKPGTQEVNPTSHYVTYSIYHDFMSNWLIYFKADMFHFVDGDIFSQDPVSELQKVESYLGLERYIDESHVTYNATKGFYCMKRGNGPEVSCLGSNKGRTHPFVSDNVMKKLKEFFRPHNEILFEMINRRFPWG